MTKAQKEQTAKDKAEAKAYLLTLLPPGSTAYTVLKHVSSSGMSRRISVMLAVDGKVRNISWDVSRLLGYRFKDGALTVGGCGMDMGFSVVYNLSSALYPDGHTCAGEYCRSNDHSNGDKNRDALHEHPDGGYAVSQSWA